MSRISWLSGVFRTGLAALSAAGTALAADTLDAQSSNDIQPPCLCADGDDCNGTCPWVVYADAVFLQRAALNRSILLQPSGAQNTTASAARASDFKFGFAPGADVTLVRNFGSDASVLDAVDFRFLGVNGFSDSFQTFLPNGDNVPFKAFQPFGNGAAQNWNLAYRSNINSLEFNAHHQLPSGLTLLAGARWVELNEHLIMDADSPSIPQVANFDFGVRNDLVGFQLGLQTNSGPTWGRWRLNGGLKAGVYDDFARNSFGLAVDGVNNVLNTADSANHIAFVGEIQTKLQYSFSDNLSGEIGYQTLWIDGVAIAGSQISATDLTTHSGINTAGHAFYQGGSIGLNLRF